MAANNGKCERKDNWSDDRNIFKRVNDIVQFFIKVKKADKRKPYMAIFINYQNSITYKKPKILMDNYKKIRKQMIIGEYSPYHATNNITNFKDCAADCKNRYKCLWFTFYNKSPPPKG